MFEEEVLIVHPRGSQHPILGAREFRYSSEEDIKLKITSGLGSMGNHSGTHLIGGLIEGFNESKRESQCGRTVVFEQTLADLLTYLFYCQLRPGHMTIVGGGWNGNESAQITRGSLHNARSKTLFGWQNELGVTCLEFGNYPVVGEAGLEPAHPFGHRNLNPARLPIPPLAHESAAEAYPSTLL